MAEINFIQLVQGEGKDKIKITEYAPVKRGKWVLNDRHIYECSECGLIPTHEEKEYWHYCPDCGARMEKSDETD